MFLRLDFIQDTSHIVLAASIGFPNWLDWLDEVDAGADVAADAR